MVFLALVCLSGCAVPLAPGYKIEKQSITVRFVPGSPPHLAIRADYRLANTGNAPLEFIEVGLPGHKSFGRENLGVQVDGKSAAPSIARGEDADEGESSSTEEWPLVWRIPFAPAWPRKQKRALVIEYDLTAATEPRGRMCVAPSMFYLNDSGWFPDPLAPKNFLAKDLVRPDPADLRIVVPEGFRATGSGELKGERKANGETAFRFQISKDDFDPFVIAGQYHEQRITTTNVVFWSAQLLPNDLQHAAGALDQTFQFYVHLLGSLPRDNSTIYVLNTDTDPMEPGVFITLQHTVPVTIFTGQTLSNSDFAAIFPTFSADESLAATWFTHLVAPHPQDWPLANGLSAYVAELAERGHSDSTSRDNQVSLWLKDFEEMSKLAIEQPPATLLRSEKPVQLNLARLKDVLFMFALEDKCGRDNLVHALTHMISALRFQEYGYDDFRSALEQECHQDLGPFFRSWLNEKGIPADFRAKYEPASQKKN